MCPNSIQPGSLALANFGAYINEVVVVARENKKYHWTDYDWLINNKIWNGEIIHVPAYEEELLLLPTNI